MNNLFLINILELNISLYYDIFLVLCFFMGIAALFLIIKQSICKSPILNFLAIVIILLSIIYNYMLTISDLSTAIASLYIFHLLLPFLFPSLLFHLNYTYLNKKINLVSLNYFLFPFIFFLGGVLFVDTTLFFESAVASKSYGITLVEIDSAILYYLVYIYMIFTSYLMLTTLLKARRNLNIDRGPFVLYSIFIIIAPILHIAYFEFKFIKVDLLLFLYLILVLILCYDRLFVSLTYRSDKMLANYMDNMQNPIFSLDNNGSVIYVNKAGKHFAKNHFSLQDTTLDVLSKCNWHDFITAFYEKNIELIDDFGYRTLRFKAVNILDVDDSIKEQILIFYDYTSMALLQTKVDIATKRDAITKTLTRSNIYEEFERTFKECSERDRDMSIILVKVEALSSINKHFSDLCGDYVLKKIARILTKSTRNGDLIGRVKGDTFLIILIDTSLSRAKDVADRILTKVENENFIFYKKQFKVKVSTGVSNYRALNEPVETYYDFLQIGKKEIAKNKENISIKEYNYE
ncbi:MAG: GGDEF domain-containing protein [Lachnospirales bacterium]